MIKRLNEIRIFQIATVYNLFRLNKANRIFKFLCYLFCVIPQNIIKFTTIYNIHEFLRSPFYENVISNLVGNVE